MCNWGRVGAYQRRHSLLLSQTNEDSKRGDPDQLTGLVLEVVPNNSCLIFCSTKKNCENVAQLLCEFMPK